MIDEEKLAEFNKSMEYYLQLLKDPELMPVRTEDSIPVTVGLNILDALLEELTQFRQDMTRCFDVIIKIPQLAQLEQLVVKQREALQKVRVDNYWNDLKKCEDFDEL